MAAVAITHEDVAQVANETGQEILAVLTKLQGAAATCGDNEALEQLTAIKNKILFGEETERCEECGDMEYEHAAACSRA